MRLDACIAEVDRQIDKLGARLSLAADRDRATTLTSLFETHGQRLSDRSREAFGRGLLRAASAQLRAFPENLFWDFDALGAHVARVAREDGPSAVTRLSALMASVQQLFGRQTHIRFRYVHDFMYGFDWAKWVAREPASRSSVPPFGIAFLDTMWRRGHELLDLIAHDDQKYPKIAGGAPRNPFGFSREPDDERRLFRDLAAQDLIPVKGWQANPSPVWDRPFQELRAERARVLGGR
ncbi:MAG: ferrochelatase [Myxococcota bacterium]